MYLISLYFDEKTNKILGRYMEKVAEKTGNDFMIAHQVPPHMTICQIEAKSEHALTACMEQICLPKEESRVEFVSIGMLLPYVLYIAPVYNAFLHELMLEVNCRVRDMPDTRISRYYMPMSWLPHITIGKTLSGDQLQKAVQLMAESFSPFEGYVTQIGLARVNPHRDIVLRKI